MYKNSKLFKNLLLEKSFFKMSDDDWDAVLDKDVKDIKIDRAYEHVNEEELIKQQ